MGDDNNDVSLLVPALDVPVGLDDLFQRVESVDNWLELSRFLFPTASRTRS
jgi:hypothetical protein